MYTYRYGEASWKRRRIPCALSQYRPQPSELGLTKGLYSCPSLIVRNHIDEDLPPKIVLIIYSVELETIIIKTRIRPLIQSTENWTRRLVGNLAAESSPSCILQYNYLLLIGVHSMLYYCQWGSIVDSNHQSLHNEEHKYKQ